MCVVIGLQSTGEANTAAVSTSTIQLRPHCMLPVLHPVLSEPCCNASITIVHA
jgi:hypothetical protein